MTWIWVEDKDTGHRYDVRDDALDESVHKKLDLKSYPDLDGPGVLPRPTKYRATKSADSSASTKAGQPASSKES